MIRGAAPVLGLALAIGCTDDRGPRLDSASPASAGRGSTVVLAGRRLCGPSGDCTKAAGAVQLGESLPTVLAQVVTYDDTSAQIVVPAAAPVGATTIVVTVDELASNALPFEVLP
jgi:hypothetical protein